MKKRNLIALLVCVPIAMQSITVPMSAENIPVEQELSGTNEYELLYSDDVLDAYKAYATDMYEQNLECMSIEDFVANNSLSKSDSLDKFNDYMIKKAVREKRMKSLYWLFSFILLAVTLLIFKSIDILQKVKKQKNENTPSKFAKEE